MTFYLKCEENGYACFVEKWAGLISTKFVVTVHSYLGEGGDNSKEI
jgi:hypothetical protein